MIDLSFFKERLEKTHDEIIDFKKEIKEKDKVEIITMGESIPLMNHRQFIFDNKEETVDMNSLSDEDISYKNTLLGISQRISRIFRSLGGGA